ncbi:MAG TPA: hypothetical protein PK926_14295 [Spirochaetota bacterium]|nr:hypothetical protein [Spirochaetota bacterium]HPI90676.1 hypothetical protein [Spirochaetota bacterium]HPR49171.1 hypothetical protein [Spirochaetota bacterium]
MIWIIIAVCYLIVWLIPAFTAYTGQAPGSEQNFAILRDYGQFKWYVIPLLLVVINLFADEMRRGNWSGIMAACALFLMDAFNETWNGLFYTATGGYSAVWMCSYPTAYQPLIGWNIEIIFMFLMMGIASTKLLPKDKEAMIFGKINNRHFFAFIMAWMCVFVEIVLNLCGALVWNYWWWRPSFPWLIFIIGYLPFFEIAFLVYDLPGLKQQITVVGAMAALFILSLAVFIPLGWL